MRGIVHLFEHIRIEHLLINGEGLRAHLLAGSAVGDDCIVDDLDAGIPLQLLQILLFHLAKGDETDYLLRMIRQIEKQLRLLHLIELTRELYRDTVNDDLLQEALEGKKLTKFASRLMQVLHEQTLLDEGYMPIPPLDDRGTRKIRESITNHLKI